MQESTELGPLARQRSLPAPQPSPSCSNCRSLLGGRDRRGKSLADFEFDALFRDCRGFFCCCSPGQLPHLTQPSHGSGSIDAADGFSDNDDDELYSKVPSRWRHFCRKLKAEARRNYMARRRPTASSSTAKFHYDALSYAMNFDDGTALMKDAGRVQQMRLHSMRFSGGMVDAASIAISAPA